MVRSSAIAHFGAVLFVSFASLTDAQIIPRPCIGAPPTHGPCVELGLDCSGSSDLDPSQCAAWQEFFDSTNGHGWRTAINSRSDPCNIHGNHGLASVASYCIGPNLVSLDLSDNGLKGTLPDSIGELKGLQFLVLSNNNEPLGGRNSAKALHGSIPESIGNLTELQVLDLGGSDWLTGTIPKVIGNLQKLKTLRLYHNRLHGHIPPELGSLAHLNNLYLYNNLLRGRVPPLNFTHIRYCGIGDAKGANDGNVFCTPLPKGARKCNLEGGIKTKGTCPPNHTLAA